MASGHDPMDRVSELREALRRRNGPARARLLVELAQAQIDQYMRGAGASVNGPLLDEAIDGMEEALTYLDAGSGFTGAVTASLAWMLGLRHAMHGGGVDERDRAIRLLEDGTAGLPQGSTVRRASLIMLGQLFLNRATEQLKTVGTANFPGAGGSGATEDAARAASCFRRVIDESADEPEFLRPAEALFDVAEVVRDVMVSHPPDLGRMVTAMSSLQRAHKQMATMGVSVGAGRPGFAVPAATESLDRSVPVLHDDVVSGTDIPIASAGPRAERLRTALDSLIPVPELGGLLETGAALPSIAVIDDLVALASSLAEFPHATITDRLLFAVAIYLRSLVDDGGWGDSTGTEDRDIARRTLLDAASALTGAPADTVVLAFRLAAALDTRDARAPIRTRLSVPFAPVAVALRKAGADALLFPSGTGALAFRASGGVSPVFSSGEGLRLTRLVVAGDWPDSAGVVSHVGSAAQLVDLAGRKRPAIRDSPLFVVDPRGVGLDSGTDHTRRLFYPHAVCFGRATGGADARGTADEVRGVLHRSLLHLACGVTPGGGLELAGGTVLEPPDIAAADGARGGGLAVLPPVASPAALPDALLATHYAGVVCWRAEVPSSVAALTYHVLHRRLVHGTDPASAVAAVRRWLADPARERPPDLPTELAAAVGSRETSDPAYAAALILRGL